MLKPKTDVPTLTETITAPTPVVQLWQAAKKSNWLVTFSILSMAAGVFALVNGSTKLGSSAIAASSVSLFMSLAVARYAVWMATFGMIGSASAALFSVLARRKALVEIIKGVEVSKEIYNHESDPTILKEALKQQSPTTKKIVGDIKNDLKLKGQI